MTVHLSKMEFSAEIQNPNVMSFHDTNTREEQTETMATLLSIQLLEHFSIRLMTPETLT